MMIESFYLILFLVSNALLLGVAIVVLSRFDQRVRRIEEFWDSPTGAALADDGDEELRAQMQATRRLERRVGELQRAVKLAEIKAPAPQAPVEFNIPLENAVRMARHGASVEDLTRNCGLNIGEARLMQKLHGKARQAAQGTL